VDNGPVAVFTSLVQGEHVGLIDTRVYLPESWTSAPTRCQKAGIPSDKMAFRTKPEFAVEMVSAARKKGIRSAWIGGDGLYGHDSKFRDARDADGDCSVLDVHDDETVYREASCPSIPEKKAGRGRTPTRYQVDTEGIKVKEIVSTLDESSFKECCFRDGSKGGKRRNVFVQEVYTWNGKEATPRKERVIVSKNLDGTNVTYSRCHERTGH